MKNHRAILFPHSSVPQWATEGILSSFETLTVCEPWYMENAVHVADGQGRIDILYPPIHLKPPKDFMKLLAEYRVWMSQNRGYTPPPLGAAKNATWDIRQALRHEGKGVREPVDPQALKWHFILHLERELEENRTSTEEMLLQVKSEKSPLAEALGDAIPSNGYFDDLALSDSPPSIEEHHLKQVLSAWFGLFGPLLPKDGILLTMAPDVLTFASELFETSPLEASLEKSSRFQEITLPPASTDSKKDKDPLRTGLSGKTLILMNGR